MIRNKHLLLISFLLLGISWLHAQQVNYKILEDNPEPHPWVSVNLDLFQLDMFAQSIEGMSFNIGAWGFVEPVSGKVGISYQLRKSWLALGKLGNNTLPGNTEINAGAYVYLLHKAKSQKETKVVLKTEDKFGGYQTGPGRNNKAYGSYTETTYIMVPASRSIQRGVRGGLYFKSSAYTYEPSNDILSSTQEGKFTSAGLYAGLLSIRKVNVSIEAGDFGRCHTSYGMQFYLDAIVTPLNTFNGTAIGSISNFGSNVKNPTPIGFRFGYRILQIASKAQSGRKFGISASAETGIKPYLGFFINAGIGITLVKAKKS